VISEEGNDATSTKHARAISITASSSKGKDTRRLNEPAYEGQEGDFTTVEIGNAIKKN